MIWTSWMCLKLCYENVGTENSVMCLSVVAAFNKRWICFTNLSLVLIRYSYLKGFLFKSSRMLWIFMGSFIDGLSTFFCNFSSPKQFIKIIRVLRTPMHTLYWSRLITHQVKGHINIVPPGNPKLNKTFPFE